MKFFRLKQFNLSHHIARWLYHTFKRWAVHVPASDTINGFDANKLPIVGIVRYFDFDEDHDEDEDGWYSWYVFQPEWWWRFYNDVVWPVKTSIRRLLVWLKILPPLKSEGGFLVPPEFYEILRREIPIKTSIKIDMSTVWNGEKNDPIA